MKTLTDTAYLELLPDIVLLVGNDSSIRYVNRQAEGLLGRTTEELTGRPVDHLLPDSFDIPDPEPGQPRCLPLIQVLAPGQVHYALHGSGEDIPVDLRLNPVEYDGLPHLLIALRDARPQEDLIRQLRGQLAQRATEGKALQVLLREQAIRDGLTGLYNRRYLDETLPRELSRSAREKKPVTLVMLDIDHFRQINERHGYNHGDLALACMGSLLRQHSRQCDIACRYGSETFAVVLVNANIHEGWNRAEDWRQLFSQSDISTGHTTFRGTVSAGVAQWMPGESAAELFTRADTALYKAKRAGRNCVIRAGELAI